MVNVAVFIIILLFLILIVIGILGIGVYNKLFFYKNKILDKFSAINDCLKERVSIIDDI